MAGKTGGSEDRDAENRLRRAAMLHPLRRTILRSLLGGGEAGVAEISAGLEAPTGRVAYHLRILVRRKALAVVPRCRPNPPLYRSSPGADWARKMLAEIDERASEGGEGGENEGLSP